MDSRADPQATQKISREQLEAALLRTKSGTRPATRSTPNFDESNFDAPAQGATHAEPPFVEPRDDSPQVTIERIDSMEFDAIDPGTLPPMSPLTPLDISLVSPAARARTESRSLMQRLRATPRMAFVTGIAVAVCVTLVALMAFFAGRLTGH